MDETLTAMAFLGQSRLYDRISWNSHLSMAFLGFGCLSIAFLGFSLLSFFFFARIPVVGFMGMERKDATLSS